MIGPNASTGCAVDVDHRHPDVGGDGVGGDLHGGVGRDVGTDAERERIGVAHEAEDLAGAHGLADHGERRTVGDGPERRRRRCPGCRR